VADSGPKSALSGHFLSQSAARQEGVISREQLRLAGLSDKQIRTRERDGELHPLYTDVWAVGHRNLTPKGHLIAALLSCGPASFLSHRTAAALHGLRPVNVKAIEVTVVAKRTYVRPGLEVHRTAKPPAPTEIRTVGLLRYSSVPRTLIELASRETPAELDRLITEAAHKRLLNLHAIEDALARHARRPGLARLKEALAAYRPRPDRKSNLERAFDRWLLEHPEIPEPQRNVYIGGWEIDCWWPEQRVVLELDGRDYHIAVQEMERDRLKDTKLQLLGIRPMRVTGDRWDLDRAGVHSDLMALLGLAA
jgi:very-short-patch-repair endonuclease